MLHIAVLVALAIYGFVIFRNQTMSSNPSPACFSLQGTKTCMMYSQYSVYPSKEQFDNLVSFDKYMSDFSPSNQNFQTYVRSQLGCSEYKGEAIDNLQAFFCGYIMQTSTLSFQCNAQTPNPICKSNAAATINSFEKLKREVCKSNSSFQVPQFMKVYSSSLTVDDPSGKTCIVGLELNGSSGNSTTSTTANSENELPNSLKIGGTYFIVGVSVGSAILLIIVIITAIICIKRSRKDKPVIPHQNEDDFETMDVIYEYVPNLFDEIQLSVGEQVLVKIKFDDGWAYGMNMSSKKEGSFPMACVASPNQRYSTQRDTRIKQRASSLYGFPS